MIGLSKRTVILAVALMVLQLGALVYTATALHFQESLADLQRENIDLRAQLHGRTVSLCNVQLRLGDAYRVTLETLMDQLGLTDDPQSAAATVLTAYREGMATGGMGGP